MQLQELQHQERRIQAEEENLQRELYVVSHKCDRIQMQFQSRETDNDRTIDHITGHQSSQRSSTVPPLPNTRKKMPY